jgi:uncharacterized RDD family membrane protein YckC
MDCLCRVGPVKVACIWGKEHIVEQQPPPLPAQNPYAAPTARVVDVVESGDLILADRGTRLGAAILDTLVGVGPIAVVGIVAAIMLPASQRAGVDKSTVVIGIIAILVFAILIAVLIVNMVLLHRYGQTIAKRWLNIKIVRTDGSRCGLTRVIFARWLPVAVLNWIFGLIPIVGVFLNLVDPLMIFRNDYRCLHDLIADTIVVKA